MNIIKWSVITCLKKINRHILCISAMTRPPLTVVTRKKSHSMSVFYNVDLDSTNDFRSHPLTKSPPTLKNLSTDIYQTGLKNFMQKLTVRPKEAKIWLKYFQLSSVDTSLPFAILLVNEDVFFHQNMMDPLVWSLTFLINNNMNPVLVFEVSEQLRRNAGLLTGTEDCKEKRRVFGQYLQEKLAQFGAEAELLFEERNPLRMWQLKHSPRNLTPQLILNAAEISNCIYRRHIPIVSNIVDSSDAYSENVLDVLELLVSRFRPMKTMILGTDYGVVDANNKVISDLAIPSDIPLIDSLDWLPPSQKYLLRRCASMVQLLPSSSSIILTSADTIIQELFTHHGTGTMIKCLEKIINHRSARQLDKARFKQLLELSFGKKFNEGYWELNEPLIDTIYVSEKFWATAVVLKLPGVEIPYLDKIAVHPDAQGTGLATGLWNEIVKDYPKLFWRSRRVNKSASAMYNTVSQGSWKQDDWTIFWYGLKSFDEVHPLVCTAVNRIENFEKSPVLLNSFR